MGTFCKTVLINDEEVKLKFHVIPNEASNFKAIVGSDVLSQVNVNIGEDGMIFHKKVEDNFIMHINIHEEEEIDLTHIEDIECKNEAMEIFRNYQPNKCKSTDIKMSLILKNDEPVYQRPRRLEVPEKEIVEKQINAWLDEGIIRPSTSDYASPIVLVAKKDGQTRICCDYRKLNKIVVKDRFPLLLIEDVLDSLQGAKYFSTIDLKNGFFVNLYTRMR